MTPSENAIRGLILAVLAASVATAAVRAVDPGDDSADGTVAQQSESPSPTDDVTTPTPSATDSPSPDASATDSPTDASSDSATDSPTDVATDSPTDGGTEADDQSSEADDLPDTGGGPLAVSGGLLALGAVATMRRRYDH